MSNKIGIITFHRAVNYGAVLQSYALNHYINRLGKDCEVIDYECQKFKDDYKIFNFYGNGVKGILSGLVKAPYIAKKNRKFEKFVEKYIKLSSRAYNTSNVQEANREYSTFITGSDQVWNLQLTGLDLAYLLDFVDEDHERLSYAASMGKVDRENLETETLKTELSKFKAITVRENEAKDVLSTLLPNQEIGVVLDPVFLVAPQVWASIAVKPKQKGYILIYKLHEESVYDIAEQLAKQKNLEIVCIQNSFKKKINAKYVFDLGPEEFLGYFMNASYVVTDSFHGAAFSIIFRKNLKVLLKTSHAHLNSRITTLLDRMQVDAVVQKENLPERILADTVYHDSCIEQNIAGSKKVVASFFEEEEKI